MADESLADYTEFLQSKFKFSTAHGFDVADDEITPCLFPHQRDIVRWAVKGGRRAIFAAFGLGKTVMQIETLRLLHKREPGRYLIIAPLGVRQERGFSLLAQAESSNQ